MSKGSNTPGIGRLAVAIRGIANGAQDASYVTDFGLIGSDFSLRCDSVDDPIPKGDYQICRSATVAREGKPKIKPGDRVLVALVEDEAVVIDVMVEASDVF